MCAELVDQEALASLQVVLKHCKLLYESLCAAKEHADLPHVKEQLDATYLHCPIPAQILEDMRANGFETCSIDIQDALRSFFRNGRHPPFFAKRQTKPLGCKRIERNTIANFRLNG